MSKRAFESSVLVFLLAVYGCSNPIEMCEEASKPRPLDKVDHEQALKYCTAAAEKDDITALNWLGIAYGGGLGVPLDPKRGVAYWERAAAIGYDRRVYTNLGVELAFPEHVETVPDPARGIALLEKAAADGGSTAQVYLYCAYSHDPICRMPSTFPLDLKAALRWLNAAVELEDPVAKAYLGIRHARGDGVPLDQVRAESLMRSAAASLTGDELQYELAKLMSASGRPKSDLLEAKQLLSDMTARSRDAEALLQRVRVALGEAGPHGSIRASSMSLEQVARDGATYVLIDAIDGQRRGTLKILNGFAVETSDKYPDQSSQFSLSSELSDPWTNCLGKEELVQDPYSGDFKRWNALCKATGPHSYPSTGFSGGTYSFEQSSGDLYWVAWNQGGTRTNYYLKAL